MLISEGDKTGIMFRNQTSGAITGSAYNYDFTVSCIFSPNA